MCKIKDLTNKKKTIQSDKVMFASFSSSLHVALSHIFLEKSLLTNNFHTVPIQLM